MVYLLSIVSSMSFLKQFALLCFLALWAVSAEAATYYVRTGGSDGHSCNQARTDNDANARSSIQGGVDCVEGAGDTVIVHGGTYGSFGGSIVTPNKSGSDLGSGAITLRAATGETVWFQGGLEFWSSNAEYWIVDGINLDRGYWPNNCAGKPDDIACRTVVATINAHIRLQNLEAKNASYYGMILADDAELINVRSHGHGKSPQSLCGGNQNQAGGQCHGFYVHGERNFFDGVEAYDNDGQGIQLGGGGGDPGTNNTVRNSKLHDNTKAGIALAYSGANLMYNNIFYNNNNAGISAFASNGQQIYNNTAYGNGDGIGLYNGTSNSTLRNNIVYNNGSNIVDEGSNAQSNTLTTDPHFVNANAGDFHLQAGSPAINAGVTVSSVTTDFEKTPRPQGGQFDIGAYEYTDSAPRLVSAPANFRRAVQ